MLQVTREEILTNAKNESDLSDLKQHADKMIRGFENFNSFSSNRAIWELVQNACDLSKDCKVIIDYSNNGFSFTHNGKPFTTKALISLVKQVSGKYGEESDIPEVGKYGTGFLTTHTFGRKFYINSLLEANNSFFEIKDFLIDRSPKEWKTLSEKIRIQKENVYKLITEGSVISENSNRTTYKFIPETEQELNYIIESSKDLEDYVPIVLTINDRLKKVTIINSDNIQTSFERIFKEPVVNDRGVNLFKTTISKNGNNKIIYSIIEEDDQIEVILPINENLELIEFSDRVARLFLYYPLVGSENFGINFIINCNRFLPTEPRDGIHLQSNKDQVKDQEEENRRIIEKASRLIFDFLKSNVINVSNPLLYAKINFKRNSENSLLNDFFENLQNSWTEEFKTLPIVETVNGFKSVEEISFFKQELLNNTEYFDDIYALALMFNENIPAKHNVKLWSMFIHEWTNESVNFIGHENLVASISKEALSKFDNTCLVNYYKCLIAEDKTYFFSDCTLLPNLDGKFCSLNSLLIPIDLSPTLIEIGKVLIPQSIDKLIHKEFYFNFKLEIFNRKNFSNNVKTRLDEMQVSNYICIPEIFNVEDYHNLQNITSLNYDYFTNLIKYCKLNHNINSQSKPINLTKILSKYYLLDDNLIHLSSIEVQDDNLDIRSARKILVQVFFNLLKYHNSEWVKANIPLLMDIAVCNEDSLKDVYATSKIYPNQINELKCINELKRDNDVNEEIKDLYNKVTNDDVRKHMVYRQFNEFVADDRYITNKYLTNQIEDVFFGIDINNVNDHPFKVDILNIISKLREKHYSELFPRLDGKKALLMLEIVTNESTKDDIFSIVTLKEDQLKKLGQLVQNEDFEAILSKATVVLEQENQKRVDFRHKYEIGTNIERLIREKLSIELQDRISFENIDTLETNDVQGGQDIVIFIDELPVYFIEVKSRWNSKNSVSMSKLQLERAVEENERYALCSVDITRYTGSIDRYNLPIDEILPLTKFVANIGNSIKPLIEENLIAEKNSIESIHLIEYRGVIPQEVIKIGDDFQQFIGKLSSFINEKANIHV